MPIITTGIDLAKNILAVHGVNGNGRAELVKPKVSLDQRLPLIANLAPRTNWLARLLRHPPLGAKGARAMPSHAQAAREDARSKRLMQRPGIHFQRIARVDVKRVGLAYEPD